MGKCTWLTNLSLYVKFKDTVMPNKYRYKFEAEIIFFAGVLPSGTLQLNFSTTYKLWES